MTLSVAIRHRFAGFELDAKFQATGGVAALFGRSGSGKTTVLKAVAGLLRPDRGRIVVDGATLADSDAGIWMPPHRRRLGCVFQEARLFPHLSVRGNLLYGRRFSGGGGDDDELARVANLLGIESLLGRRPASLSGGEKQRVAIGRALLSRPRFLLMDEPLASLDEPRKDEILPYLERLRDEARVPILYVSHSAVEVARLATTVVAMHEGRVLRSGSASEVLGDPASAPAMGIRRIGAVLDGTVASHHADGLTELALSGGNLLLPRVEAEPGARLRIRIEAQDVMIARVRPERISALNVLEVEIAGLRPGDGPGVLAQLATTGGDRLLARVTRRSAEALELAPGLRCYAVIKSVSVARSDVGRFGAPPSGTETAAPSGAAVESAGTRRARPGRDIT